MVSDNKHNILVFFCDQLRIDLLKCYGSDLVRTPNIEALAGESTVFNNAYTPTAICSPARASLMTGLYPHGHHMFNNSTPNYSYCQHLPPECTMIQDWADEETDYETAYFGKWHIGPEEDLFKSKFHNTHPRPDKNGGQPYLCSSHPFKGLGTLVTSMADGTAGELDMPMEKFPDVATARYTQQFIKNRKTDRPFLTFCSLPGPHAPWFIPKEFGIRYDSEDISLWPNCKETFTGKPIYQKKLGLLSGLRRRNEQFVKESLACCFSYLELIDQLIGEVIATLKESGQYDNTVIVFTADHGDMAGAHGFLSKGSYMYDEIYRIPMMIHYPGLPADTSDTFVNLMDLTATMMHIMSSESQTKMGNDTLHGSSLLPIIKHETDNIRSFHYAEYHGDWYGHRTSRMVTDGRWKVVWNMHDLGEMYDLRRDPGEMKNLYYDSGYKDIRNEFLQKMIKRAEELDDGHVVFIKQLDLDVEDELYDAVINDFGVK